MRHVRTAAFIALPLSLCACGLLVGDAFDDLVPEEGIDSGAPVDAAPDESIPHDGAPSDHESGADALVDHETGPTDADAGRADVGAETSTDAADASTDAAPVDRGSWTASAPAFSNAGIYFEPGGNLGVVSRIDTPAETAVDTFAVGYDSKVWNTGWRKSGWNDAYLLPWCSDPNLSFVVAGGVAAVAPDPHYIYVFSLDARGLLYHVGTWHDEWWSDAGPSMVERPFDEASAPHSFAPGGPLSAIAYDEQNVVVVTIGTDGFL